MRKFLSFGFMLLSCLCIYAIDLNYPTPTLPGKDFVLLDATEAIDVVEKSSRPKKQQVSSSQMPGYIRVVNYINVPSNVEEAELTILVHNPDKGWIQYTTSTVVGFAKEEKISASKGVTKYRYFAVKCSVPDTQIVMKKYKGDFYFCVYLSSVDPSKDNVYPYFKREKATIFSHDDLPKGCDENIRFMNGVSIGVAFTVYVYDTKESKWFPFATANLVRTGDTCFADFLTSKDNITKFDFFAIEALDGKKYSYSFAERHDDLYIYVSDFSDNKESVKSFSYDDLN